MKRTLYAAGVALTFLGVPVCVLACAMALVEILR